MARQPKQDAKATPILSGLSVGEIIAFCTAGWIIVAFVLEWGYWTAINVSLSEIPVSMEYLINASIVWTPTIIGIGLLFCAYELSVYLVEKWGASDSAKAPKSRLITAIKAYGAIIFNNLIILYYILLILLMLGIIGDLISTEIIPKSMVIFGILACLILLIDRPDDADRIMHIQSTLSYKFVSRAIVIIPVMWFAGCLKAMVAIGESEVISINPKYAMIHATGIKPYSAVVLRNTGNHVIIYQDSAENGHKIQVLQANQIAKIVYERVPEILYNDTEGEDK